MKRSWIKLYLEILDDAEFGELPEFIKWRAIELFLVAGENGNDGLLPPVARLAWRLRLDEIKIAETLSALTQVGVVHETPQGWKVTNFLKRQAALTDAERAKNYRDRHAIVTEQNEKRDESKSDDSLSSSPSDSVSSSEEGGVGGEPPAKTAPSDWIPAEQRAQLEAFTGRFGKFHSRDEIDRYLALVEKYPAAITEVMDWAAKKDAHLTNRPALLDTLETAAKGWKEKRSNQREKQPKDYLRGLPESEPEAESVEASTIAPDQTIWLSEKPGGMTVEQAWQSALVQLQMEMPKASFDTWVRDAVPIHWEDGLLRVSVRDDQTRKWLEGRLTTTINRLLTGMLNCNARVEFVMISKETREN